MLKKCVLNVFYVLVVLPINHLCAFFPRIGANFHYSLKAPVQKIETKCGCFKLSVDSPVLLMRANTFFSKEPETLAWIDAMTENDVLFDVGANIGIYSVYAALKGLKVFAFEPESLNYAELNKNIYMNELSEKIVSYNLGLGEKTCLDFLNLSTFTKGWSMHTATKEIDFNCKKFKPVHKQGLLVVSLDDLVNKFKLLSPTHIKIDVDGLESEIIKGASKLLKLPTLKSILIELNDSNPEDHNIIKTLQKCGFNLKEKKQSPLVTEVYRNVFNYIFERS